MERLAHRGPDLADSGYWIVQDGKTKSQYSTIDLTVSRGGIGGIES
jgi:hypothetical protein